MKLGLLCTKIYYVCMSYFKKNQKNLTLCEGRMQGCCSHQNDLDYGANPFCLAGTILNVEYALMKLGRI